MAKQVINNGETGLLTRTKLNSNFDELYLADGNTAYLNQDVTISKDLIYANGYGYDSYYVDKQASNLVETGSSTQPFHTIQACLNAIGAPIDLADANRKICVYIESGSYDEDIITPIQRLLTLSFCGVVVLGDGAADNYYNSTTPRTLTISNTATGEPVGAPSRTVFAIRGASGETSSTHSAYTTGNMIISGDLSWSHVDGNTTSHESLLQGVKVQGDVTTNAFELGSVSNVQIEKCFFDNTFNASNANINVCRSTEFDGLITAQSVGRFVECEITNGITAAVNNYYPPNGFFNCIVKGGTWTITDVIIDAFTRQQIVDNSISIVGSYVTTNIIENSDVDTGTETVDTFADTTGNACFWNYVIKKGANIRAGIITAAWDVTGDTVESNETSTNDIGDTTDVTLTVDISANSVRLRATTTSDNWSVKVFRSLL